MPHIRPISKSHVPLEVLRGFECQGSYGPITLQLTLRPGEAWRPDTPAVWHHPLRVRGTVILPNRRGWNGSYHDAYYDPSLAGAWMRCRHIGTGRHVLNDFARTWITPAITARAALRRLVRPGD